MIRPGSKKIHDYLIGTYLNHHYLAIDAIVAVACEFETLKISCKAEQKIKVLCDLQADSLQYYHHHRDYHDHRQGGPRCLREAHG